MVEQEKIIRFSVFRLRKECILVLVTEIRSFHNSAYIPTDRIINEYNKSYYLLSIYFLPGNMLNTK
jgi:hypothetical protein